MNNRTFEQRSKMGEKKHGIEERLIDFAVGIIFFVERLQKTKSAAHLGGELLRSGTSPSLNYGEAKSAESKNDGYGSNLLTLSLNPCHGYKS